eukprot:2733659-Amphidinium_carterae.1
MSSGSMWKKSIGAGSSGTTFPTHGPRMWSLSLLTSQLLAQLIVIVRRCQFQAKGERSQP